MIEKESFEKILGEYFAHSFIDYVYKHKFKNEYVRLVIPGKRRDRALGASEIITLIKQFANYQSEVLAKPLGNLSPDALTKERIRRLIAELKKWRL